MSGGSRGDAATKHPPAEVGGRGEEEEEEEEDAWDDFEGEEGDGMGPTKCIMSDSVFQTVAEAVASSEANGFRFREHMKGKTTYDKMKIINYARREVSKGTSADKLNSLVQERAWEAEEHLQPFLETDPLLFTLDSESDDGDDAADLQALRAENAALKQRLDALLLEAEGAAAQAPQPSSPADEKRRVKAEDDEDFFYGYGKFDIHSMMLEDVHRTATYRTALSENPSLMKGAAVLDVGCGSGILSMFAARGGASHVVGVDASTRVATVARRNVEVNNLAGTVSIVTGRVEDQKDLPGLSPGQKVDVLVSEWMGYCLLYESMLDSVLHARDAFLKPGGAILPDIITMHAAGLSPKGSFLNYWRSVYGFNMTPVMEKSKEEALKKGLVQDVDGDQIVTSSSTVRSMDLTTIAVGDVEYTSDFVLAPLGSESVVTALVVWFDTEFSPRFCKDRSAVLTTSPYSKPTHWHQTVFHLKRDVFLSTETPSATEGVNSSDIGAVGGVPASELRCTISISKGEMHRRDLDVSLSVTPVLSKREGSSQTMSYAVS